MMKSFRDRPADFPVYDRERFDSSYLDSLGALATPRRVDAPPPANVRTLPVAPQLRQLAIARRPLPRARLASRRISSCVIICADTG